MRKRTLWIAAALAVAGVLVCFSDQGPVLLAWLRNRLDTLRVLAGRNPFWFWSLGVLAGAAAVNCPIPVAAAVKVVSGAIFGVCWGFALNLCASVLGAAAGYAFVRGLLYRPLRARWSRTLDAFDRALAQDGFWFVLSSRLIMATPFFLVNVLAGLSPLRLWPFLASTALGVIPSSLLYAFSGAQLDHIHSAGDLLSPQAAPLAAALGAAALLPVLVRRLRGRR